MKNNNSSPLPSGRAKNKRRQKTGPAFEAGAADDLSDELSSLRRLMRLVEDKAASDSSLKDLLHILDGLGKASTRLAALLKTRRTLGESNGMLEELNQVMAEVLRDLEEGRYE